MMQTTKALLLLFIILFLQGCNFSAKKPNRYQYAQIEAGVPIPESMIDSLLEKHSVPAISIATVKGGKIDWIKAYGVRRIGSPEKVDSSTLFQAASISKPVSSVVALRMVDQGKLTLDENVNDKLQSWKVPPNEFTKNEQITLRRLLSHSAGLPMHGVPEFESHASIPTLIQILDGNWDGSTESVRPVIEPGKEYRYSGGGYIILQLLLTDISNRSFEDLAKELVLESAKMTSSTFEQPLPEDRWDEAAIGHYRDNTPIKGLWHILPEQATGGLWTTPKDLAHFMIELWKSYQGISDTLLPQYLAREMLTRQAGDMGLGIMLPSYGVFRFSHSGGTGGYRCTMVLSVDRPDGAVLMTNGDSGEDLIKIVFELIGNSYGWEVK